MRFEQKGKRAACPSLFLERKVKNGTLRLSRAQRLLADFAEAEQSQATEGGLKLKAELSSLKVVPVDL